MWMHILSMLAVLLMAITESKEPKPITIGAILSNNTYEDMFLKLINNMTAPKDYVYQGVSIMLGRNPVVTANDICDNLIRKKVMNKIFGFEMLKILEVHSHETD